MTVAYLGVPSSAGAHHAGQELAPAVLRNAGLLRLLTNAGMPLIDRGDLDTARFQPDADHPRSRNLELVRHVVDCVRLRTLEAVRNQQKLLVVGGDCTLTIGVVAGLVEKFSDLGLFYMDGDVDVTTPETTPSGILDSMGMAHLFGQGIDELARIGPRFPLMTWDRVVFFGSNPDSGWLDPPERDFIERHPDRVFTAQQVRANSQQAVVEAVTALENSSRGFLLHFDVDVIDETDFPGADTPHRNGISFRDAFATVAMVARQPNCLGIVLTEFNPERDVRGSLASKLTTAMVGALAGFH